MVKGFSQPSRDTATDIIAEALPFSITNVIADTGGDSSYVTANIYGARFQEDAIVKFVRPGIAEYQPVSYEVIDGTHIIAIFDFTDAPRGLYDVKVINPDAAEAIVPYRYLVERAIETDVTVGLGDPRVLGIGQNGLYGTSFNSLTNLDIPYIHFQYGVPELGDNDFADATGLSFNATAYPGLGDLLAIAELEDGTFLISGGDNRGSLYQVERVGADVGSPLVELPHPVFEIKPDGQGSIWATTGGDPLLQLDAATGEIVNEYGEGITQSVAIDPETGLLYLSSGNGIEIFDPKAETMTHFSNLRVGNLEFAPDGSLWATRWPERGEVVKFARSVEIPGQQPETLLEKKPQLIVELDSEADSIAFGKPDTELANLLFISNNDGELVMLNLANRDYLTVADGGSRGDIVETTSDGKVLVSQSNQVDIFSPVTTPEVAFTNPADEGIVALPKGVLAVTFDQSMYVGEAREAASLLNPANYTLVGEQNEALTPRNITYDESNNTVYLEYNALTTDTYKLVVSDRLANPDGITLEAPYQVDFTAISDFSELVDLEFINTRSVRGAYPQDSRVNGTISFDVALTNQTKYDLSLPLNLVLQPEGNSNTAEPTEYGSISHTGAYFIDLSDSLPDGILEPGESITEQTVTIYNPDDLRFDYEPGVYTLDTNNQAPVVTSEPLTVATAGESYVYNVAASDPDGSVVGYLLYDAPKGMTVNQEGVITWSPTSY